MEITCYRDTEMQRESLYLPAATYNLAKTLLSHSPTGLVFLPIRSMQYLAILDAAEIVFIDGVNKSLIDIAWQNFHPNRRESLEDPVAYELVCYSPRGIEESNRLQNEFHKALLQFVSREKEKVEAPAKVLKFEIRREPA